MRGRGNVVVAPWKSSNACVSSMSRGRRFRETTRFRAADSDVKISLFSALNLKQSRQITTKLQLRKDVQRMMFGIVILTRALSCARATFEQVPLYC